MNLKLLQLELLSLFSGIAATAVAQSPSGTLPIVYVTTENGATVIEKEDKVKGSIWIDPCESGFESLGSASEPIAFTLSGRGNYTWTGFDKKPYKIKFDSKTSIMGMPKNKTFALLAHADDNMAFLRNTMGFELSRRLGLTWTPTQIPVEYVFNGQYQGIYFLCETIKVDKKRVNITEQNDLETDETLIDGGWLVEIDNYDTDPHIEVTEADFYPIYITYKSPEELSPSQESYLRHQMEAINDAIYASDKSSTLWEEYIDIESAVRYYIVQEILDDCESYHGSCYLYKDRGEGEKWHFGPVWDFGNTFQRGDKNYIWHRPEFHQVWIGELYKFPRFRERVKEVWQEFKSKGCIDLEDYINDFIAQIKPANALSAQRWPAYHQTSLNDGATLFKTRLRNSINWLSDKWEEPKARIYLRGNINTWGLEHEMTTTDGNIYTITLPGLDEEFKIATEDWKTVDLGASSATDKSILRVVPGELYTMSDKGPNMTLSKGSVGPCTLTVNLKDKTLLVDDGSTGIDSPEDDTIGIRIEGLEIYGHDELHLYTLTGLHIASGQRRLSVPAKGLYIVVSKGKAQKIAL
ncbi:MAG: CotH kinase family protein [Clostridium sp.]|nr:CotH kinase family protein [Prevotella sp.]MCM1428664.1 CotH kinase family protein [Clostridium sp.]MCM1475793.1 CotH kinase family protein [Muribaculaceae bacterium]